MAVNDPFLDVAVGFAVMVVVLVVLDVFITRRR